MRISDWSSDVCSSDLRCLPAASRTPMLSIIRIRDLNKTYASGFQALKSVDLDIRRGEIFALLGPNGAGKTTLISIVCGIVNASRGSVQVDGFDIGSDYRKTRSEEHTSELQSQMHIS